ncbi:ribose-phosphate pyrophosphokinase [Candidatus Gracilibacteria bacterium]|nr:ribose-phosphate pyrophosphokinase [Candidatus Gracilibacteria bacterium]MCF7819323.1 ribose-phosphate pyrophosphokinase [Candidatus Gracilibacteria bacterium]
MKQEFKIFSGSSHPVFAQAIADHLKTQLGKVTIKRFSCGETYVKYDETFRGQEVFLVQTCRTGQMNNDLIELLLMIDAAKQSFAKSVHVILPYFAYSRQDKIHAPREGISAKLFAQMIQGAGADHVITMHLHSDQIQGFFDCPVDNLNPRKELVQYFKKKNISDPVVVSPDAGGAKDAKKFADELGAGLAILHKQRPAHNKSEVTHVIGDIENKTPIIVDDMVDTGGSVIGAAQALLAQGSKKDIYLCATHAILSGDAQKNLEAAKIKECVFTDSLPVEKKPKNFNTISMTPLFSGVVRNVVEHKSVSKLYF